MANNYNSIAKYYDTLSRVVYQRAIIKAQVFLIQFVKDNDRILLVGGGTGWILEELSKLQRKNITVVYVEKSAAMIKLAKKKATPHIKTTFMLQPIEYYTSTDKFDVVLTPFLFDNFKKDKISILFTKLDGFLKPRGIWLYADFVNDGTQKKLWQQFLLRSMYKFFRLTADIETQELIDMKPYFTNKYQLLSAQLYYKKFIQAIAYRKKG